MRNTCSITAILFLPIPVAGSGGDRLFQYLVDDLFSDRTDTTQQSEVTGSILGDESLMGLTVFHWHYCCFHK
jgi:hypothetical protein